VAGCCECGDEPSGSCATELVSIIQNIYCVVFQLPGEAVKHLFASNDSLLEYYAVQSLRSRPTSVYFNETARRNVP
jgi:hypothetical protein